MNIQEIDKWLDNEYGCSYTRLEELHDFVVEQDLKHREEKDKEIERLNKSLEEQRHFYLKKMQQKENIIKEVREYIEENWISQKDADNYRFDDAELIIEISDIAVLFDILDKGKE